MFYVLALFGFLAVCAPVLVAMACGAIFGVAFEPLNDRLRGRLGKAAPAVTLLLALVAVATPIALCIRFGAATCTVCFFGWYYVCTSGPPAPLVLLFRPPLEGCLFAGEICAAIMCLVWAQRAIAPRWHGRVRWTWPFFSGISALPAIGTMLFLGVAADDFLLAYLVYGAAVVVGVFSALALRRGKGK